MKILHVVPAVAPRYGGPSHAIVGMGRALMQVGVDVLVATTDADGPGRVSCNHGKVADFQGVPTIFFPRQLSESFKYSHPLAQWLTANVQDYDVVHIHAVFSHSSLCGVAACRRARVPYIVRPLGSLDPWSLRQRRLIKIMFWHACLKRMLRGAAAIHYTTRAEQGFAESQLGLERGVVIPLGVGDNVPAQDQAGASTLVASLVHTTETFGLILSRLHPKKGIEAFIDDWLAVTASDEYEAWKLLIAGDGDPAYVAGLKLRVASRGAEGRVQFVGWVSGPTKWALLAQAAFLALPSRQENFGIVVAEALSCGTPVLVSDSVGLAAEVKLSRLGWVTSLRPADQQACLNEVLGDADERRTRGAAGRKYAEQHFIWSKIAQDLIALYQSVGARRPA